MTATRAGSVRAGVRATFLGTIVTGILQFGLITVLARLLTPAEYGAYAICLSVTTLSAALVNSVLERALVVDQVEGDLIDRTAEILLLGLGTSILTIAVMAVLHAMGMSAVAPSLLACSLLASIIGGAAIIPRVSMRRQLQFNWIVLAELSSLALGAGLATVCLALAGWGSYALAIGQIVQNLVLVSMLRFKHPGTAPLLRLNMDGTIGLVRSAAGIWRTAAAEIGNSQVAPLVLATRLGVAPLGLFNRTYSLVQMPIQLLTGSLSRVMVSALFAMRTDLPRFRENLGSLVRVAGVTVAPVAAGIAGTNETFVLLAFGPKWLEARSFLPLIAISAWAVMMATLYGIALEALRAFDVKTRNQLISTGVLIILSLIGTWMGLVGAVTGIALSGGVLLLLTVHAAAQELKIPLLKALSWLVPGLVVAAPCLILSRLIGWFGADLAVPVRFACQIAACAVAQPVGLLLLYPNVAAKLIEGAAPFVLRLRPLAQYLSARGALLPR